VVYELNALVDAMGYDELQEAFGGGARRAALCSVLRCAVLSLPLRSQPKLETPFTAVQSDVQQLPSPAD
jgi:hypothetical protein